MVVYGDDQSGYPHPDHLKVHDIGVAAFGAAGDPERYREAGDPWQPEKLYYTEFSVARFKEVHQKFVDLGLQSPFDEEWRKRWEGVPVAPVTTSIDIAEFADVRGDALLAHATQVDPTSPFWFGLPRDVMRTIHPYDDYRLASVVAADGTVVSKPKDATVDEVETDLFAGIRTPA
jgi:mycothiol S-conjugate amidase